MRVQALITVVFHITSNLAKSTGTRKVVTAWYAGWHATSDPAFLPSQISWSKYTDVTYAFGTTTKDPSVISLEASDAEMLPKFVAEAHKKGVKAKLSIGGWTGSRYWSSNVATATNRHRFIKALLALVKRYKLAGLDFDWEYIGGGGIGCNENSPSDSANFLAFLRELRADPVGKNLLLSAAAPMTPFVGADGNPRKDVSEFGKLLDYIALMVYDVNGPWSTTGAGPNAPLKDSCAPKANRMGSATSAVKAWNDAGVPMNKLVLGVASYGRSFHVDHTNAFEKGSTSKLALYPPFNATLAPTGDAWDDAAGVDQCGNASGPGGIWNFWGLVKKGYLTKEGKAASGAPYLFDTCTQTPYVYDKKKEVLITFDDAKSFAAKGTFIKSKGLGGLAMWHAGGDYKDILLDSIRKTAL
ncbi:Glycoside hydrolase family 18 protein [Mycena kentingensis (nom. inval.)]|nr:Glycoside hydrolase family 18 protein [Mycena kentingensis (nom. inval.)]